MILRLSSDMIGNSDDETNFPHKLLLTNRQVANLCKAFANHTSTDIKLSKTQLSKMIQIGGFLGRLLGSLLKKGLPLMKNVIQPSAKIVLIPLGLTAAAASAADAGMHKRILGSGHNTTLIISNDEMKYMLKIVKFLEDSGLLLEGVSGTIKNELKEQKGGFLSRLLGTLGASVLGNMLADKGFIRAGEAIVRVGYGCKNLHLKNFFDSSPSINKF